MTAEPLRLKAEIAAICAKADLVPRDVELIEIRPMGVTFTLKAIPMQEGGTLRQIAEFDYVWEEEPDGGPQEGGQAPDRP